MMIFVAFAIENTFCFYVLKQKNPSFYSLKIGFLSNRISFGQRH